ncbi:MAG: serine protease [Clostridia bacterium]|nr:serine protease [Clostridia bacterium]
MKRKISALISILIVSVMTVCFASCDINLPTEPTSADSSTGTFVPGVSENVSVNIVVTDPSLYAEYTAQSLAETIERVKKGIVGITVKFDNTTILGSGTVIACVQESEYTYIATSHSLIAGASSVSVKDLQTGDVYDATPVGTDPITDICVIRINAIMTPCEFYSECSTVKAGEPVFACSDVLGSQVCVTTNGILGATEYKYDAGENNVNDLFIADLTTSYSSLGGALFTEKGGFLLGMIRTGAMPQMPAFVIPSDTLLTICTEIIENGYVEGRYKLGVTVEENKSGWGITESIKVTELAQDGCIYAEGLGLKVGDTILALNYKGSEYAINKAEDFYSYLYTFEYEIGDTITFTIERNSTRAQVSITIIQYDYFSMNVS